MANSTVLSSDRPTDSGKGDGGAGGGNPDYTAFVLVPVFFLLGLLGVIICHVLKRKGYRCTTEAQDADEEFKEEETDLEQGGDLNDTMSENNDTVGQIVHYIMKNEANSDALKAMIHENSIDSDGQVGQSASGSLRDGGIGVGGYWQGPPLTPTSPDTPTPPMTPISPGAPPGAAKHTCNHLHTITGGVSRKAVAEEHLHALQPEEVAMDEAVRPCKAEAASPSSHHGEVTVLAVGRFRVTKCEKPARDRRTLLITDSNGSVPTSPTEAEPKSRTMSESQQSFLSFPPRSSITRAVIQSFTVVFERSTSRVQYRSLISEGGLQRSVTRSPPRRWRPPKRRAPPPPSSPRDALHLLLLVLALFITEIPLSTVETSGVFGSLSSSLVSAEDRLVVLVWISTDRTLASSPCVSHGYSAVSTTPSPIYLAH
ncbi:hypothetical protein L3Q82_004054 [Scortum barcoo]|uniref:Uncharacterized protein n=1 Tax=Scortum barcoo TaxID=214431 RepID=A0ACB8X738_9TELE|nr:hypothetical protein L3Q82_004054 [Scortum barcoo]